MELETLAAATWRMIAPLVAIGAALHFMYGWTGRRRAVAIFGAVNESYWEHIKIALWPVALLHAALFAIGGYQFRSFAPASAIALYSIPITIVGLTYLYKRVARRNILAIDIATFAISILVAQTLFARHLEQLRPDLVITAFAWLYLLGLFAAMLRFTLSPPDDPDLFIDPITGRYGIPEDDDDTPRRSVR